MKSKLYHLILNLIVLCFIIITVFPFFVVLVMGTYTNDNLTRVVPYWFSNYFMGNLLSVLRSNFLQSYFNSVFVSFTSVGICLLFSAMIGYGVSKFEFKGKKLITAFIVMTMMVPQQITIVGYVMEMRAFHMNNSLLPIIVCWFATPFAAFFMIQFIREAVPSEIIESARVDGANELHIFFAIVRPFIMPGIATIGILTFLWSWNSFMLPLLTVNKSNLMTLPVFINNLTSEYRDDIGSRMNAVSLTVVPILVVFSFFSKNFIKGIASGALKG
jgi:ABC-type glycerol-3-phosphate transport system permease component